MESPYLHGSSSTPVVSHAGGSSRPSLGFPLGTALLLMVIFSLSGIFSCCYHWDKLRRNFSHNAADLEAAYDGLASPTKHNAAHMSVKVPKKPSMTVILMPGDNVPKFIALPCPCQPPRQGKIVVDQVKKSPPKPPGIAVPFHQVVGSH